MIFPDNKKPKLNQKVLMSGADYFGVEPLNPYSLHAKAVNRSQVIKEFNAVKNALISVGIEVIEVDPPAGCIDGVFTANWALCHDNKAIIGSLPAYRAQEEISAENYLKKLGIQVVKAPFRFSGQGDAIACGDILFSGRGYRNDERMHKFIEIELGYKIISLDVVPLRGADGKVIINKLSGWPDSYFYDIDLAISFLTPELIAWCPDAFTEETQKRVRGLERYQKIEVSFEEAVEGFACNLVSTGYSVVMSASAPKLRAAIKSHGLDVVTVDAPELAKGGGGIRCCALTLSN